MQSFNMSEFYPAVAEDASTPATRVENNRDRVAVRCGNASLEADGIPAHVIAGSVGTGIGVAIVLAAIMLAGRE